MPMLHAKPGHALPIVFYIFFHFRIVFDFSLQNVALLCMTNLKNM